MRPGDAELPTWGTSVDQECANATKHAAACQPAILVKIARRASTRLQLEILQGRGVRVAADQVDAGLFHARPDAPDERQLVDRDVRDAIVEDLLDLVHQRLALLDVGLARLALEEVLDLRDDAGGVDPLLAHVGFEPRGRVAAGAGDPDDEVLELLLAPRRRHRRTLE